MVWIKVGSDTILILLAVLENVNLFCSISLVNRIIISLQLLCLDGVWYDFPTITSHGIQSLKVYNSHNLAVMLHVCLVYAINTKCSINMTVMHKILLYNIDDIWELKTQQLQKSPKKTSETLI